MQNSFDSKNVCLKTVGGIGDVLLTVGGVAKSFSQKGYTVTAAVREHQIPFVKNIKHVDFVIRAEELNYSNIRDKYYVIDFEGVFNTRRYLRKGNYYDLVQDHTQAEINLPEIVIPKIEVYKVVALHPGSSNNNRRWDNSKWEELAYQISENEYEVVWLGTKDEYGFEDEIAQIYKLSNIDEDLMFQYRFLSCCSYFIGNDSCFAHMAGMLDISGRVLFFSTHPKDVIDRYISLQGIHRFKSYDDPSRSLQEGCEISEEYKKKITVDFVLEHTPFEKRDICIENRNKIENKDSLYVLSDDRNKFKFLSPYYYLIYVKERIYNSYTLIDGNPLKILYKDKEYMLQFEESSVVRAIRELRVLEL